MLNGKRGDVATPTVIVNDAQYQMRGASIKYGPDGGAVYRCTIRPFSEQALEELQARSTQELRLGFARETLLLTQVHLERDVADSIAITGQLSGHLPP